MMSYVSHTSVDCHGAYALSEFWRPILGYIVDTDDPNEPGHEECPIFDPETAFSNWGPRWSLTVVRPTGWDG